MNTRPHLPRLAAIALLVLVSACIPQPIPPTTTLPPSDTPPSNANEGTPQIPLPVGQSTPELPASPITHLPVNSAFDITFINMVGQLDGWAIGGLDGASDHVFRTWDAGLTWKDVTPPAAAPTLEQPVSALGFFKSVSTAWVVYAPAGMGSIPAFLYVWRTSDGGDTWQYGTLDTANAAEAFSPWYLWFADDINGWLMVYLGAGMMHNYVSLYATHDGGATWTLLISPNGNDGGFQSFSKTDMVFTDAQTGWLTRDSSGVDAIPHVFRTKDGGTSWARIDLPPPPEMPNLFSGYYCGTYTINRFSADSVIVALLCRNNTTPEAQINFQYATTDGGVSWQSLRLPDGYMMNGLNDGLFYFDPLHAYALGHNIYLTADGGRTWELIKQVTWDGQFSFYNMNLGWAVATSAEAIAVVNTTNGCAKWNVLNYHVRP